VDWNNREELKEEEKKEEGEIQINDFLA